MRHLCDGGQLSQAPSAAEESTLRRWWKEYRAKMQEWAGLLESRTYEPSCRVPGITDNKSLPGMKVNKTIIDRFVELRSQSKTFSQISDIVQAEFRVRLSNGTLWKWQKKFLSKPPAKGKRWKRSLVELSDIARQNKGKTVSRDEIRSIFGYSQSTKIEDTQLFTTGIIARKGNGWLIKS